MHAARLTGGHDSDRELQPGFTARIKLVRPEHSTDLLSDLARQEFCKRWHGGPVRSVNVTAGKISPAAHEQLELFFDGDERKHEIDAAVDRLRDRFGKKVIFYAGSIVGGTYLERAGYVGGHKGESN
nr:hypothetical protein [uncultured Anaeromusa sp.]